MSWPVRDTIFHSLNEHEPFASTQCWKEWTTVGMDCCILVTIYSESNSVIFFELASWASNCSARNLPYRKPVKLCSKTHAAFCAFVGSCEQQKYPSQRRWAVWKGDVPVPSVVTLYIKKRLKVFFFNFGVKNSSLFYLKMISKSWLF